MGIAVGLGVLLIVLSVTNAGPALAQTFKPVMSMIVNDSEHPVPVTGSVVVRDADAPALQPFRASTLLVTESPGAVKLVTVVPAGKRLVVEDISWNAAGPPGSQVVQAHLRIGEFGSAAAWIQLNPPHPYFHPGVTMQEGAQPARQYFDAGDEIWVAITATATGTTFSLVLSGHFIDLP
jgi:hypothetical protein